MEPTLDRLHPHAEDLGNLRSGQPLDVPQEQHLAVHGVERRNRLLERALDLFARYGVVGVSPGAASRLASPATSVSSERSVSGANLLRRRFLMQKLRAMV